MEPKENISEPESKKRALTGALTSVIIALVFYISDNLIDDHSYGSDIIYKFVIGIFIYTAIYLVLGLFVKFRFMKKVHELVSLPLLLFLAITTISQAFIVPFVVTVFTSTLIGFVYIILTVSFNWPLQIAAAIYFTATFSAIILTTFGEKLVKYWLSLKELDEADLVKDISIKLSEQDKVRKLIFLLYFLSLVVLNLTSLSRVHLIEPEISIALLQSFATYIAFDRLRLHFSKNK